MSRIGPWHIEVVHLIPVSPRRNCICAAPHCSRLHPLRLMLDQQRSLIATYVEAESIGLCRSISLKVADFCHISHRVDLRVQCVSACSVQQHGSRGSQVSFTWFTGVFQEHHHHLDFQSGISSDLGNGSSLCKWRCTLPKNPQRHRHGHRQFLLPTRVHQQASVTLLPSLEAVSHRTPYPSSMLASSRGWWVYSAPSRPPQLQVIHSALPQIGFCAQGIVRNCHSWKGCVQS